jgi:patatin-like phospholipase/acyl hydrolase
VNRKSPEKDINPDSSLTPSQRVLVLQGGGSLGAYEAGVYKVLYKHISKQIGKDENVFDIIAGTSIGAISQKWADYSSGSINKLFAQGIGDARSVISNSQSN